MTLRGWWSRLGLPAALVVAVIVAVVVVLTRNSGPTSERVRPGASMAATFLDSYVTSDGRVIRHDQGGDIVSEGEAYAMVLAEVADRPAIVRAVWHWTQRHLQRPDGLLSFHATSSGQVLDQQSASDADTLAAYALLRYRGSDAKHLHLDGDRIAAAILANETVTQDGVSVLVAGPWAMSSPQTVDPSYLMPPVFRALSTMTGDARWRKLADDSLRLLSGLTSNGQRLPSDWAHFGSGTLTMSSAPSGGGSASYGEDAARTPVWLAYDCSTSGHSLAAAWWPLLRSHPNALSLSPQGQVIDGTAVPLSLVASGAAAHAAGDTAASSLYANAAAAARSSPTYYGTAWAAFGQALDTGRWHIDSCAGGT
ncbi:MAG TPA: glycosyl hydrolase family 8 [Mycobacteriales bacterium]|nr:glycosyl hydrolase family 8 [Mycobacteriales bacterium]